MNFPLLKRGRVIFSLISIVAIFWLLFYSSKTFDRATIQPAPSELNTNLVFPEDKLYNLLGSSSNLMGSKDVWNTEEIRNKGK